MRRRPIALTSAATAAALALLAAGCGGGGGSPGVASIASSTGAATATTSTTQSGSGPGEKAFGAPGKSGHFQVAMSVDNAADGAKFSACMRKHGVTNFPDPDAQGVITFGSGRGIDPSSPSFQSARSACEKLLPNGGRPTPQQQARMQQKLLEFSKCMRAHGIEDFPDPSNGGLQVRVHPGSDLDPNNPDLMKAVQACKQYQPGGGLKGG